VSRGDLVLGQVALIPDRRLASGVEVHPRVAYRHDHDVGVILTHRSATPLAVGDAFGAHTPSFDKHEAALDCPIRLTPTWGFGCAPSLAMDVEGQRGRAPGKPSSPVPSAVRLRVKARPPGDPWLDKAHPTRPRCISG